MVILMAFIALAGCNSDQSAGHEHAETSTYTCPMHPQVVQDEPGSCPICGMDLVPQTAHGGEVELTDELSYLLEPANAAVVSSIQAVKPVRESKTVVSTFPGVIAYDTRQTYSLPVRFGGRIEELFVRYNFQPVEKGQKIMEIYSPELLTSQRELLFLLESDPGNSRLIESAKQRLRLLGVSEAQINQLVQSGQEQYAFPVYSPYTGYIVEAGTEISSSNRTPMPQGGASGMSGGMGSMGGGAVSAPRAAVAQPETRRELSVREGMYVDAGQALFRIIDASRLWAEFNVRTEEARLVDEGDPLLISWGPGENQQIEASVDFVQPFFSEGENFSKIRAYLSNTSLRVGQLVEGSVQSRTEPTRWIPALAVLDTGRRQLVFVKENGLYRPREIVTGIRAGDMVEVQEGLADSEAVAHNAQFMVDSESFVRIEN